MIRLRLRRDSFIGASDAVAFVIFAVMLITIGVITTGLYLAITVPSETKKSEFNHAAAVTEDFVTLQTSIHALERARSTGATTSVTIQLMPEKMSIIVQPLSSGAIHFSPLQGTIAVRLAGENSSISGPWTDENFVNTTRSNLNLSSGELKLVGPPHFPKGSAESNMTSAEGHLGKDTGSNCTRYENLTWYTSIRPSTELVMKVRTDMFPDMRHAKNWSECLEIQSQEGHNEFPLADLLSVSHGHRYVQYRAELRTYDFRETPTLFNVSINFSSSPGGVTLANASGSITYDSNYHHLPSQVLVYENDAVIKSQTLGGFMARPPGISITNSSSGVPRVNISLVYLTGTNITYSGAPSISLRLFRGESDIISNSLYFPKITLNLTTDFPDIWSNWFNQTLEKSGINESHYVVVPNSTARTVEVTVFGNGGGVELYLEKMEVLVNVQA
jgi:hypothetical protein